MIVRRSDACDVAPIRRIHLAAFPTRAEADLVDRLSEDGDLVFSLIAEVEGRIVGQAAFSRMEAPFRALGLGPLAVLPEYQRQGVGSALVRAGLELARAEGWQGTFVLGNPAYYQRFDFSVEMASCFSCRYSGPHFMLAVFDESILAPVGETVSYARAFDAFG